MCQRLSIRTRGTLQEMQSSGSARGASRATIGTADVDGRSCGSARYVTWKVCREQENRTERQGGEMMSLVRRWAQISKTKDGDGRGSGRSTGQSKGAVQGRYKLSIWSNRLCAGLAKKKDCRPNPVGKEEGAGKRRNKGISRRSDGV